MTNAVEARHGEHPHVVGIRCAYAGCPSLGLDVALGLDASRFRLEFDTSSVVKFGSDLRLIRDDVALPVEPAGVVPLT